MSHHADPQAETVEAVDTDSFDAILKRVATDGRGSVLEPGTRIAQRFRIDRMIGAGGMGAVYIARDTQLDRNVAVKVHHLPGGGLRLRREAIAMARLAHPNVVTVFEAGELGAFPYVVMEYVPGTTLRAWLAARPRSVADVLAMVLAAGDGVIAAHEAGLVHRDIKPENILIGEDGRPRIGDFGLARESESQDDEPVDPVSRHVITVTQTGAVLGTPAYMAPEQLAGEVVDARADQFAFCVTVWEAIWGERPFAGGSIAELAAAVKSQALREPALRRKVPAKVRQSLVRGLCADPAARFPTMAALLAALRAPRRRRARIAIAGGAIATACVASGMILIHASNPGSACAASERSIASAIPDQLPGTLRGLGATAAADRLARALARFRQRVGVAAHEACEATTVHTWTEQRFTKATACLTTKVRIASAVMTAEVPTIANAQHLARRAELAVPAVDQCTSALYLEAMPALPSDPIQLGALIAARSELELAMISVSEHRGSVARIHLDRADQSALRATPWLAPSLLVVRALVATSPNEAAQLASDAYFAARAHDDDEQSQQALHVLLDLALDQKAELAAAPAWLRTAIADADRMAPRAPWLAASLYLSAARLAAALDDGKAALRLAQQARTTSDRANVPLQTQAMLLEADVDTWTGHPTEGIALFEKALAAEREAWGDDAAELGSDLAQYALALHDLSRDREALAPARQALAILERASDPDDAAADTARVNLAAVLSNLDLDQEAQTLLETARAHYRAHGAATNNVATVDVNLAILHMDAGNLPSALSLLEEALAITTTVIGADRTDTADVLYNLAVAHRKTAALSTALAEARQCAAIYGARRPGTDRHLFALALAAETANDLHDAQGALAAADAALAFPAEVSSQATAWPQLERGRALLALGRRREAREILAKARVAMAAIPLPERVEEIDRLLRGGR